VLVAVVVVLVTVVVVLVAVVVELVTVVVVLVAVVVVLVTVVVVLVAVVVLVTVVVVLVAVVVVLVAIVVVLVAVVVGLVTVVVVQYYLLVPGVRSVPGVRCADLEATSLRSSAAASCATSRVSSWWLSISLSNRRRTRAADVAALEEVAAARAILGA
jgi:hypothetical protein